MATVRIYLTTLSTDLNDLQEADATTNKHNQTLYLGWDYKDPNYNEQHPIFEKDLTFLGAITVSAVSLTRNANSGSGTGTFACDMNRVRRADWDDLTSTWTIYKTGNNWATAGGTDTVSDIDTTNQFGFTESIAVGERTYSSDANIVALFNDAITNQSGILRVLLKGSSPSGGATKRIDWSPSTTYFDITYTGGNTISAAVTGTATASITEADVVAGGKTIILTLTNETWVASGDFTDTVKTAIRNGITSAQNEAAGWNQKVRPNIPVANVVRTSDTVVTVTLQAQADYNITAQETITCTVPPTATAHGTRLVASPTFTVDTGGEPPASTFLPRLRLLGVG